MGDCDACRVERLRIDWSSSISSWPQCDGGERFSKLPLLPRLDHYWNWNALKPRFGWMRHDFGHRRFLIGTSICINGEKKGEVQKPWLLTSLDSCHAMLPQALRVRMVAG